MRKSFCLIFLMLCAGWVHAHPMASTTPEYPSIVSSILASPRACETAVWAYQEKALQVITRQREMREAMRRALRERLNMASIIKRLAALSYVDPDLLTKLNRVYATMKTEGYTVMPVETFRSPERQAGLLASGAGVTTVGAMRSCHQYGLAVDSVVFRDGVPQFDLDDDWVMHGYERFGELVMAEGLEWGGNWTNPRDYGHAEKRIECRAAIRSAPQYFAALSMRLSMATYQ
jgi:uncharacterized protein YcbK (DUF882 family)